MLRPLTNNTSITEASINKTNILCTKDSVLPARKNSQSSRFSYANFAKQLARQPLATGAIAPSSRSLGIQVVEQANVPAAKTVVELGPGTGVFTEQILAKLSDDAQFFAIEVNPTFVQATKNRCPKALVYLDAATSLPKHLNNNNCTQADCIVSSLPWTLFDENEQDEILQAISTSLKPGGVFISIIYLGAKARSRGRYFIDNLSTNFTSVNSTPIVWQNLPPTQIYRCIK